MRTDVFGYDGRHPSRMRLDMLNEKPKDDDAGDASQGNLQSWRSQQAGSGSHRVDTEAGDGGVEQEPRAAAPQSDPSRGKRKARELKYALPTDRLKFDTQLSVLRAYGAASGSSRERVRLDDVASAGGVAKDTVSITNEFFRSVGLISKEGREFRPSEAVVDFTTAHQWNEQSAPFKLAEQLRESWFGKRVVRRLSVQATPRAEIVSELAIEAGASPSHRPRVEMLVDYLRAAGIVAESGEELRLKRQEGESENSTPPPHEVGSEGDLNNSEDSGGDDGMVRFSIPIPGHKEATITVPQELSEEDWEMLRGMIDLYIRRLQKSRPKAGPSTGQLTVEQEEKEKPDLV